MPGHSLERLYQVKRSALFLCVHFFACSSVQNVTYDPAQNMRQWTYQTCTEFGYFQTTASPNQPFAYKNMVPLSYWEQMCSLAFKSTFNVEASVRDTNQRFGGNQVSLALDPPVSFFFLFSVFFFSFPASMPPTLLTTTPRSIPGATRSVHSAFEGGWLSYAFLFFRAQARREPAVQGLYLRRRGTLRGRFAAPGHGSHFDQGRPQSNCL